MKLICFGFSGSGHACEFVIQPEIVLDGDGCQRLRLPIDLNPFLGLDCLMQAIAPTSARHLTTGVLVNNDDLIFLDHIIDVLFKQAICSQELRNVVNSLRLTIAVLLAGPLLFFLLLWSQRLIQIDLSEFTDEVR